MKKIFIIIALSLVLTMLAGCTSEPNNLSNDIPEDKINKDTNNDNKLGDSTNNNQTLIDLQEKGLKIIKDQTFWTEFKNWGKVKFVPGELLKDGNLKLYLYLVDNDGNVLYKFPEFYGNTWSMFTEFKAVSFKDINKDGMKDIIVISEYMTGVGQEGAIPFPVGSIYFQKEKEFINIPELDEQINDANKNKNIHMILKFVEDKDINL